MLEKITSSAYNPPLNDQFCKQWRPRWNAAKCCISSGSTLFEKVKKIFRQKNTIFFKKINLRPLEHVDMYNGLSQTRRKNPLVYKGLNDWLHWEIFVSTRYTGEQPFDYYWLAGGGGGGGGAEDFLGKVHLGLEFVGKTYSGQGKCYKYKVWKQILSQ